MPNIPITVGSFVTYVMGPGRRTMTGRVLGFDANITVLWPYGYMQDKAPISVHRSRITESKPPEGPLVEPLPDADVQANERRGRYRLLKSS